MDFNKYKIENSSDKYKKANAWEVAIGLQKVDNLTPSEYLYKIAERNIENDISFEETHELLKTYYEEKHTLVDRTEEADKVSARIAEIL